MDQENKQYNLIENDSRAIILAEQYNESTNSSGNIVENVQESSKLAQKPEEVEDITSFLVSIYSKNPSARMFMDQIESLFFQISNNLDQLTHYTFPTMSSFQRLIVHRVADYFKMVHYLDSSSHVIVVKKANSITPVPLKVLYANSIKDSEVQEQPKLKMKILKKPRDESFLIVENCLKTVQTPIRSLEERQESYLRARARIFDLPLEDSDITDHFSNMDVSHDEKLEVNPDTEKLVEDVQSHSPEHSNVKLLFHKCISNAANTRISDEELTESTQSIHNGHTIVPQSHSNCNLSSPQGMIPYNFVPPHNYLSSSNTTYSENNQQPNYYKYEYPAHLNYSNDFQEPGNHTQYKDQS